MPLPAVDLALKDRANFLVSSTNFDDVCKMEVDGSVVFFSPTRNVIGIADNAADFAMSVANRSVAFVESPHASGLISSIEYYATSACQMSCGYCYLGKLPDKIEKADKDANKALSVIQRLVDANRLAPLVEILFIGGEPLLAFNAIRDLTKGLDAVSRRAGFSIKYALTTNGYLINNDVISWMREFKVHLNISYDGAADAVNRPHKFGISRDMVDITPKLDGIRKTMRATVLPSQSMNQLEILREAKMLGFDDAYIDIARGIALEHDDAHKIVDGLIGLDECGRAIDYTEQHLEKTYQVVVSGALSSSHCAAGTGHIVLNSHGEIRPCANVNTKVEFENFGPIQYDVRDDPVCGQCAVRFACQATGGGCRAWRIKNNNADPDLIDCLVSATRIALAQKRRLRNRVSKSRS